MTKTNLNKFKSVYEISHKKKMMATTVAFEKKKSYDDAARAYFKNLKKSKKNYKLFVRGSRFLKIYLFYFDGKQYNQKLSNEWEVTFTPKAAFIEDKPNPKVLFFK